MTSAPPPGEGGKTFWYEGPSTSTSVTTGPRRSLATCRTSSALRLSTVMPSLLDASSAGPADLSRPPAALATTALSVSAGGEPHVVGSRLAGGAHGLHVHHLARPLEADHGLELRHVVDRRVVQRDDDVARLQPRRLGR